MSHAVWIGPTSVTRLAAERARTLEVILSDLIVMVTSFFPGHDVYVDCSKKTALMGQLSVGA
jgi:hypothetical protein